MYDANNRRFTAVDSAKYGHNWYVYCADNPLRYVDPTGEFEVPTIRLGPAFPVPNSVKEIKKNTPSAPKVSTVFDDLSDRLIADIREVVDFASNAIDVGGNAVLGFLDGVAEGTVGYQSPYQPNQASYYWGKATGSGITMGVGGIATGAGIIGGVGGDVMLGSGVLAGEGILVKAGSIALTAGGTIVFTNSYNRFFKACSDAKNFSSQKDAVNPLVDGWSEGGKGSSYNNAYSHLHRPHLRRYPRPLFRAGADV